MKFNSGLASKFFVTDPERNIALLEKFYLVFSNGILIRNILSEILAKIYNIEHPKSFWTSHTKLADKDAIEKLLDDLSNERKFSMTRMGSEQKIVIFAKGIEQQCLYCMKILNLRAISQMAAINLRGNFEEIYSVVKKQPEITNSEVYRDSILTIFRPSKLRAVIGKYQIVISDDSSFKEILNSNPEIISSMQDIPITDRPQIMNEGIYD